MVITIILFFIRGSSKFPSIIGLSPCSFGYWTVFVLSFLTMIAYAYRNIQILKTWYPLQQQKVDEYKKQSQQQVSSPTKICDINNFDEHVKQVVQMSIGAGILSGFGLGGGVFLVPMYRSLGCKPLQATATCAFGICITSFINCLQAISIGAIKIS